MPVVASRELSNRDFGSRFAYKSEQANSSKLPGFLLFLSEQAIKQEKRQIPFFSEKFDMLYCRTMRYKLR